MYTHFYYGYKFSAFWDLSYWHCSFKLKRGKRITLTIYWLDLSFWDKWQLEDKLIKPKFMEFILWWVIPQMFALMCNKEWCLISIAIHTILDSEVTPSSNMEIKGMIIGTRTNYLYLLKVCLLKMWLNPLLTIFFKFNKIFIKFRNIQFNILKTLNPFNIKLDLNKTTWTYKWLYLQLPLASLRT